MKHYSGIQKETTNILIDESTKVVTNFKVIIAIIIATASTIAAFTAINNAIHTNRAESKADAKMLKADIETLRQDLSTLKIEMTSRFNRIDRLGKFDTTLFWENNPKVVQVSLTQ